ncbi:MAG TPA: alpha-L-rhamnosidase N-terminal domain-containing protein, partial [Microlunatus sp.]|nr:alpha-L-rhamnosidase N-terminal domain-containing protein [Microlunatus sp.]
MLADHLRDTVTWQGSWITDGSDDPVAPLLRRAFEVPAEVRSGRLHVAGLGLHRTTLNGRPVTDARLESGLTAYDKSVIFSTYAVQLGPGAAVLGIE